MPLACARLMSVYLPMAFLPAFAASFLEDVAADKTVRAVLLCLCATLAGCDQLGIETPLKTAERQAAEAKAIGSACRHAMRAIEDCYTLNPKADKSAVFAGWREMDEYMRENKLEGIAPVVPRPAPQAASKASAPPADDAEEDEAPSKSGKSEKSKGH